ncbi:MAG: aspartate--ammonia ligase [Bacteroidota bacterium]
MSKDLYIPSGYQPILDLKQTEQAITQIKDFFLLTFSSELKLRRVTAPLFVLKGTGINDDLNGVERKVSFPIKDMNEQVGEVVNSLAKWKRLALADYGIEPGYGILTDMNAIRPDEDLDNIHSLYVDQWDWEMVISQKERNLKFLKTIVRKIFEVLKRVEFLLYENFPGITPMLPDEITFLHTEELEEKYPDLTPKEREDKVAEKYGAVFVIGIGSNLSNGKPHDGRAPDYDDWITPTTKHYKGLNGDIIFWNPILQRAFELSSMGIRVDKNSLLKQLKITGSEERKELLFHKRLLNDELPLSIGGGLGQSRICMYFLRNAHIGEVQSSIWPEDMKAECRRNKIHLV